MIKHPQRVTVVTDPSELPIFAQPTPIPGDLAAGAGGRSPGRVRSAFTLDPAAVAEHGDVEEPGRVVAAATWAVPDRGSVALGGVDWGLVASLRTLASERLMRAMEMNPHIEREEQQALGRRIIAELLDEEAKESASAGRGAFDRLQQSRLAQAVFDALFRLGRLQPLVDDQGVENVMILGHDRCVVGV